MTGRRDPLHRQTASPELGELRDALDDAIFAAYASPLYPVRDGEDETTVRAIAKAAIISNPTAMRHVARIQAAAWTAVAERVDG